MPTLCDLVGTSQKNISLLKRVQNALGRYKPEVETLPQTGSTNNLATETDIDAISLVIPMFLGARFHCQPNPMLPSP